MNQYEAMFLFDPTFGSSFEACEAEVRRVMERAEAEVVFCRKWDERRLAYRIKGRKRGIYVLVYFKAASEKIVGLERDAQLSENVLRVLILRADDVSPEVMERAVTAPGAELSVRTESKDESTEGETPKKVDAGATTDAPAPTAEPSAGAEVATEAATDTAVMDEPVAEAPAEEPAADADKPPVGE